MWSDGEEITARDFVFTVNTVHEFNLSGNWASAYPTVDEADPSASGIVSVEAVDDYTVRITFNREPGLRLWPHAVGLGAWMPEHFWASVVEQARASQDPTATLYAASGQGDPSAGPVVFDSREPGAFSRLVANERYNDRDTVVRLYESGAVGVTPPDGEEELFNGQEADKVVVQYRTGPFLQSETLTPYGTEAAVLALRQGEIDYLAESVAVGLFEQIRNDPELEAVVNPGYNFRYLAFNLREFPMDQKAFRQALAVVTDREFVVDTALQGAAFPAYTMMPLANAKWFDEQAAAEIEQRSGAGLDRGERLAEAVRILEQGGFRWATKPSYDAERDAVTPGTGLVGPGGQPLPPLELLVGPASAAPVGAAFASRIEQWAVELGIPLSAKPTDFNALQPRIQPPAGQQPQFDMAILGWGLGNPALPGFYESFWHSRNDTATSGGFNTPGFTNPEFDRLADAYQATRSEEEAFELVWEMERVLAEERPYIVLSSEPILEGYRPSTVRYPFTETLGGIQYLYGAPSLVSAP